MSDETKPVQARIDADLHEAFMNKLEKNGRKCQWFLEKKIKEYVKPKKKKGKKK